MADTIVVELTGTPRKGYQFTGAGIRKFHAEVARELLRDEQNKDTFPTDKDEYITKVDHKPGHGTESRVRIDGRIQYIRYSAETDLVPAMVQVIDYLMRRVPYAPKVPGDRKSRTPFRQRHYRDSFVLLLNNRIVEPAGPHFRARAIRYIERYGAGLTGADVFAVTNIQPYARRIEVGAHFKKPWLNQQKTTPFRFAIAQSRRAKKTKALYISGLEMAPLPGGVGGEYGSQGPVTYAEGRNKRGRFVYSGRIMRKHRIYPRMEFGPPRTDADTRANGRNQPWTRRRNVYQEISASGDQRIMSQIRRAGGVTQ